MERSNKGSYRYLAVASNDTSLQQALQCLVLILDVEQALVQFRVVSQRTLTMVKHMDTLKVHAPSKLSLPSPIVSTIELVQETSTTRSA